MINLEMASQAISTNQPLKLLSSSSFAKKFSASQAISTNQPLKPIIASLLLLKLRGFTGYINKSAIETKSKTKKILMIFASQAISTNQPLKLVANIQQVINFLLHRLYQQISH